MTWPFWKRRRPAPELETPVIHPTLDEQADRLAREAMEGIGQSLRSAAKIRQALADGALELRINRK